MDFDKIMSFIFELCNKYEEKYREPPKYIKMPDWVCYYLELELQKNIGFPKRIEGKGDTIKTILGMTVCPTKSIIKIKDMEVF